VRSSFTTPQGLEIALNNGSELFHPPQLYSNPKYVVKGAQPARPTAYLGWL